MNSARLRAYLLLTFTAVLWGLAGPIIKLTLGEISSFPFLVYRFGLSSVFALIYAFATHFRHIPRKFDLLLFVLAYAFLNSTVALGFLFEGLEKTTVLDMSLISMFGPLLISAAGVKFLNEKITKREKIGIAIAFIGTFFTVIEPIIISGDGFGKITGNLLILASLIVAAIVTVLDKKLLRDGVDPTFLANISFVVGFVTITPLAIAQTGFPALVESLRGLSLSGHLGVAYMAIISGTLAYSLWNMAQKTIEISEASLFAYLYPLFAAPLAVIWLGEKVTPVFLIGAAIVAVGVGVAEVKKRSYN
ncbi:MAG TPA: DMT family transporter [Patescibacteria group bacterium]|uniref:EamA domain-containing protein n=1 Tax=Candidatus Woesebacteria bacterium RBG_13_46_13 TaxID=1802479 RepID=A0A1F7X4K4_9BACT|nr:MAG: hypothetical protein A2Y68_01045 [Candidatus Woesebacteria bacterium RBG_13_46_13]HJX59500.1 DMT family transporter [Patescibacteria group bacterium]